MTSRNGFVLVSVATMVLGMNGHAFAQERSGTATRNASTPVDGTGTPGTVPLWTGSGHTLTNSHIQDNGGTVTVGLPVNLKGVLDVSGPINATDAGGDIGVLAGSGGVGVRGQGTSIGVQGSGATGVEADGTTYGVHATSGSIGLFGQGTGTVSTGVFGEGVSRGVAGSTNNVFGWGVVGINLNGGVGVKAIEHVSNGSPVGAGVDSFSDSVGVEAWGPAEGVRGVSDEIGVLGAIRDPKTPVVSPNVPNVTNHALNTAFGVVGNCDRPSSLGCIGIYGYGNAGSGFAHGVVGETYFGPDGAGVIGITHSNGQGVRGGTDNAKGIGVVGYNTAGGLAGQFGGDVQITRDLDVDGNAYKPGGGSWGYLSDVRLKKSIQPLNGALQQLLRLRGVSYEYINPSAFGESAATHIGMLAQDVEKVFPSWVDEGKDGYKRLTFRGFEAVAVEAVREIENQLNENSKEALGRIAELERQNAELQNELQVLSEKVRAMERK